MKLSDFHAEVSRRADTQGTKINVAETSRVLRIAFEVMSSMSTAEVLELVARGIARAAGPPPRK